MFSKPVKILDCTLRDGGYVLNWDFKEQTIRSIIAGLEQSNIDFIECGYLKECKYERNRAFFASVQDFVPLTASDKVYTLMINCGEYDISNFGQCKNKNIKIRLAFKKNKYEEAMEYVANLKKLGWDVFVNPMNTNLYSLCELEMLVKQLNKINPYGFFIVDTFGNMTEDETIKMSEFLDKSLNMEIILGLHSHNSMDLAYQNAVSFLLIQTNRTLVIDSCLYGMGRGAGNLKTEIIADFANKNFNKTYNTACFQEAIKNNLSNLYEKYSWGYSKVYHITAKYGCHPNYATYLIQHNYSEEEIERIVGKIPNDKKIYYDEDIIQNIN